MLFDAYSQALEEYKSELAASLQKMSILQASEASSEVFAMTARARERLRRHDREHRCACITPTSTERVI